MPEGDGGEPHQDRLGGHKPGNVWVSEHEISLGREGIQQWTQARLVRATSPLEGVKLVISEAASSNQKGTLLLVIDARRAYFHAKARRRVYIELPEGDGGGPGSRQCGLLGKSLYGTRDAAQNWECELGGFLEEVGLRRGQASTCLYSEELRGISASVLGADVTVKASREDAEWLIEERYEIKTQMIGEAADLDKQLQILNRTVRWSSRGFWTEADPRHVKEVIKALGLEGASPAPTPGVAAKDETRVEETLKAAAWSPSWDQGGGDHHVPCGRSKAELLVPRMARHHVLHHETVLKDVLARRTRPE